MYIKHNQLVRRSAWGTLALIAFAGSAAIAGDNTTTVTFDNGAEGWIGSEGPGGTTEIRPTGGNDDAHLYTIFNNFGITFFNDTNEAFVGDYTDADLVTISIDVKVDRVFFFSQDVSRPWLVELRDVDNAVNGYPWASVWFKFPDISADVQSEWTTFSVTFDPNSTEIPEGWAGYGDEDPDTFEPVLPRGVTFADILAGVDTIAFTTLQPGFFFGFTDFEIGIDNVTITKATTAPCIADLTGDGELDFFDVSDFLDAFGASNPIADLDDNGEYDFFDVSAFLDAFAEGCP